jgi:hypothetical protein
MKRVVKFSKWLAMMIIVATTSCEKINENDRIGEGMLQINGQKYSLTESYIIVRNGIDVNSLNFQKKDENHVIITMKPVELISNIYTESDSIIEKIEIVIYETMFMSVESIMIPLITETHYSDNNDFIMEIDVKNKTYDIVVTGKATDSNKKNQKFYDYRMTFKGTIRVEKD